MVSCAWPTNLEDAVTALASGDRVPYGGGAHWMGQPAQERSYVYLSRIPELRRCQSDEDGYRMGAALTFAQVLEKHGMPGFMKEIAGGITSPAIRNQATIGGTLVADGAGSDLAVAALVNHGVLQIAGPDGVRSVPVRSFFQGQHEVDLSRRELITELVFPKEGNGQFFFEKVEKWSVSAVIRWENGKLAAWTLAFGGPDLLIRPELDKELLEKDAAELAAGLPAYRSGWETAIFAGRDVDDRTALVRQTLLNDLLDRIMAG